MLLMTLQLSADGSASSASSAAQVGVKVSAVRAGKQEGRKEEKSWDRDLIFIHSQSGAVCRGSAACHQALHLQNTTEKHGKENIKLSKLQ